LPFHLRVKTKSLKGPKIIEEPLLGFIGFSHPEPPEFLMNFPECLRRIIGGRSAPERMRIFRRYWDDHFTDFVQDPVRPLKPCTDAVVAQFMKNGVDEAWFDAFSKGIPEWRRQNRIQQRRQAAKTRWQKEKSKKEP